MPWFVKIQEDHHTLENPESGTWEELSASHRDRRPAPKPPSGKPNVYGTIRWPFPCETHLTMGSPIGEALVGRIRWDDPMVIHDIHYLLGPGNVSLGKSLRTLGFTQRQRRQYFSKRGTGPRSRSVLTKDLPHTLNENDGKNFAIATYPVWCVNGGKFRPDP